MALTLVMRASWSNRLQNSCYGSGPIKPLVQISHPSPTCIHELFSRTCFNDACDTSSQRMAMIIKYSYMPPKTLSEESAFLLGKGVVFHVFSHRHDWLPGTTGNPSRPDFLIPRTRACQLDCPDVPSTNHIFNNYSTFCYHTRLDTEAP